VRRLPVERARMPATAFVAVSLTIIFSIFKICSPVVLPLINTQYRQLLTHFLQLKLSNI
jgi:hypothetical protein